MTASFNPASLFRVYLFTRFLLKQVFPVIKSASGQKHLDKISTILLPAHSTQEHETNLSLLQVTRLHPCVHVTQNASPLTLFNPTH